MTMWSIHKQTQLFYAATMQRHTELLCWTLNVDWFQLTDMSFCIARDNLWMRVSCSVCLFGPPATHLHALSLTHFPGCRQLCNGAMSEATEIITCATTDQTANKHIAEKQIAEVIISVLNG